MPEPTSPHDTTPGQLDAISRRLDDGSARMRRIEKAQADMQLELRANTEVTSEIRDLMAAARVGFKVLGGLGTLARWASGLATAGLALWAAFYAATHGGVPPK